MSINETAESSRSTEFVRPSRRAVVAGLAALPVAGAALNGAAWAAAGAGDDGLRIFQGRYAIHGGTVIDGYFAAPQLGTKLDVVVVVPGEAGLDRAVTAAVRRQAQAGRLVVAPDLVATYGKRSRAAQLAALMRDVPQLARHPHGSGKVAVVAA